MAYSDQEVLEAIQKGEDDKVLKHLYKEVLPKVKKLILKNNGSQDDAKDIFQDSVLIFYKQVKLGKFKEEFEIGGFIYSVSRNLWINAAKKKNRTVELTYEESLPYVGQNIMENIISREREAFILNTFSQLGEKCKEILIYSIYHKFSMQEIKEKMGFSSEDVAKTKNYKCKQRLINIVKDNSSFKDLLKS